MQTNHSLERIFHYQGKLFRTLQNEGEPWFIAADICATLGLSQVSRAVKRLDSDTVRLLKVPLPQNPARSVIMNAVNESGLYQLIWPATNRRPNLSAAGSHMKSSPPCDRPAVTRWK